METFLCSGIGLGKVIAENLKAPELDIAFTNSAYVQYSSKELEEEIEESEDSKGYAGVAVQSNLKISPKETEDGISPLEMLVELNLPSINNQYPRKVVLAKAETFATSGESENETLNQDYDQSSGLFVLSYENTKGDQNTVKANTKDEFEIIYIYPEESYTGNENEIELNCEVNITATYETENDVISSVSELKESFTYDENIGDLSILKLTGISEKLYKGFMYSNVENGTRYNTNFETTSTLSVLDSEAVENIEMTFGENEFELNDEDETTISASDVVFNSAKIKASEFTKMFGKDGSLEFYSDEDLLATVEYLEIDDENKLSIVGQDGKVGYVNDNGELVIKFAKSLSSYTIKATKPLTEGLLSIVNSTSIRAAENYGARVSKINYINIIEKANEFKTTRKIELVEPENKMTISSSEVNFSTLEPNKTTLTIKIDDTNSSVRLLDNPTIEVVLPKIVTGNISNPEILNANGLAIKNVSANGNVIKIELEGKQTAYDLKNMMGGVCIVMDIENLTFAKSTPTHLDKIEVNCIEKDNIIANAVCNVNINSREDLLVISQIDNFNDNQDVINLELNKTEKAKLESYGEEFKANQSIVIVNNTDNNLEKFKLVTLLNYKLNNEQSTFIMNIPEELKLTGVDATVQYVDRDQKVTDELKEDTIGYVVSFEDGLPAKSGLTIDSKMLIPDNLGEDQVDYVINQITFVNNGENVVRTYTTKLATKESLKVREESVNNIELPAPKEGEVSIELTEIKIGDKYITEDTDLSEGQTVKYKYRITNNTNQDLGNIKLKTTLENESYYEIVDSGKILFEGGKTAHYYQEVDKEDGIEEKTITELEANKYIDYEYEVVVKEDVENTLNRIELINLNGEVIANKEIRNNVKDAKMKLRLKYGENEESTVGAGERFYFEIIGRNTSNKTLKNFNIKVYLPEEINVQNYYEPDGVNVELDYEWTDHLLTCTVDKLEAGQEFSILVVNKVGSIDNNLLYKNVSLVADTNIDGEIITSNELIRKINQKESNIRLNLTNNNVKDQYVNGDIINYEADIRNTGALKSEEAHISVAFDDGLKLIRATLISEDGKENIEILSNKNIDKLVKLKNNVQYKLLLSVQFDEDLVINKENTKLTGEITVTNDYGNLEKTKTELNVRYTTKEEKQIQELKEEIQKAELQEKLDTKSFEEENKQMRESRAKTREGIDLNDSSYNYIEKNKTYTINGTAWLDGNLNGMFDENEMRLPNIIVSLVDKNTGDFVKKSDGTIYEVTTNHNGEYSFTGLQKGTYIVVFEFDTVQYKTTTYKKENVSEDVNSDAVVTNATIYGESKILAITDSINLQSSKNDVDIGLINNIVQGRETITKNGAINEANTRNESVQSQTAEYVMATVIAILIIVTGSYIIKKKIIDEI